MHQQSNIKYHIIMKRYNLSQIMKAAHRTYKYVNKKKGISWGATLKSAWHLEKMNVEFAEAEERRNIAAREAKANEVKPIVLNGDYKGYIPDAALYSTSYYRGGRFVND